MLNKRLYEEIVDNINDYFKTKTEGYKFRYEETSDNIEYIIDKLKDDIKDLIEGADDDIDEELMSAEFKYAFEYGV